MNAFQSAYLECALWSSTDDDGDPLDDVERDPSNLIVHCSQAEQFFRERCKAAGLDIDGFDDEQMGHDLWLTRNRHGAGFWDRSDAVYPKAARDTLTEIAHAMGEVNLYLGDDGEVHLMQG